MAPRRPTNLGTLLRFHRHAQRLSLRTMAKTLGLSMATLSRLERGAPTEGETVIKLLTWLFASEKEQKG